MRILARVRLSKSTEESTSIVPQRELIERYAADNGHTIVGWAEDVDVSGSVSPFDAPGLGEWLRPPKQDQWDILVAWKLDRLARSSINIHKLFEWIQDNDKTLVSISENIDLSNWVGRLVASVIAGVAEGELEAIRERVASSQRYLRESGRWRGGHVPYGWTTAPRDGGGLKLVHDPETFPILRRIIEEYISGKPGARIARDLTADGIAPPRRHRAEKTGGEWGQSTITKMLANRQLLGWTIHNGKPVIGDDGKPVLKCPPAVTHDEWDLIQETLAGRRWEKGGSDVTSPLLGVLMCWECGARMYVKKQKGRKSGLYRCSKGCKGFNVNSGAIEPVVSSLVPEELGSLEILEYQHSSAPNVGEELQIAKDTYDELARHIPNVQSEHARNTLFGQLDVVAKRIAELEKMDATPQTSKLVPTGETYGERWAKLDDEGRRQLLIASGITFRARQLAKVTTGEAPPIEFEMIVPEDLRERLRAQQN